MKYTKRNTINSILADKEIKKCLEILFPSKLFQMIPEEYWNQPLEVVEKEVVMPWGDPFMSDALVKDVNLAYEIVHEKQYKFITLWEEHDSDYIPDFVKNDKSSVVLMYDPAIEIIDSSKEKKPAAIICPGGGYRVVATDVEGIPLAKKMQDRGYVPFILFYRVAPNHYPAPQEDLAKAMTYVRTNAEKYHIDPDNIMIMGSSAGGHLCASYGMIHCDDELKPNKICLSYPVISFGEEIHKDSALALTDNDSVLREMLSVEKHVTEKYPKTFIWACEDDETVPVSNTYRMDQALMDAKVEHKCMIFPTGGHGCGLAAGTSAEEWSEQMLEYMK